MIEWISYLGTAVGAAVGGIVIYDRIQKARRRIGRDFQLVRFPGTEPGEHPWDPPVTSQDAVDIYLATATIHNNANEAISIESWLVEGVPMAEPKRMIFPPIELNHAGTDSATTGVTPDWIAWNRQPRSWLPWRRDGKCRISLVVLLRASSTRVRVGSARYTIPRETIRQNALKALAAGGN